ncbi:MAG: hypothetical protein L6Q99_04755, partial [Planctomycetes bacterium]|nr:hypothetical protein [Planctomycetota bacterium]
MILPRVVAPKIRARLKPKRVVAVFVWRTEFFWRPPMHFHPKFCPRPDCPSHAGSPFLFRRRGYFRRRCDTRKVPRFLCLTCSRGFSSQTFRVDYRLKRPDLLV